MGLRLSIVGGALVAKSARALLRPPALRRAITTKRTDWAGEARSVCKGATEDKLEALGYALPPASTSLSVYRLAGTANRSFSWFPAGAVYGMEPGAIDALIHYGLAVTVRRFEEAGHEPTLRAQEQQVAAEAHLLLQAAAHGLAPATFAFMLVHDGDDYAAAAPEAARSDASRRLAGTVAVTQTHSYRLSDMLHAYTELDASANHQRAREQVVGAVGAIAAKVRALAGLRVLKLNVTPDTIVFCPELVEDAEGSGDWELRGFSFRTSDAQHVPPGQPHLWDFDARLCKRCDSAEGYVPDFAFALSMLVLLATVRAQCGLGAYALVRDALMGDLGGLPRVLDRMRAERQAVEAFGLALSRLFQHTRVERDALPADVFTDLRRDVARAADAEREGRVETAFGPLVRLLVGARRYEATELPSATESAERRAARLRQRGNLLEVARRRAERRNKARGAVVVAQRA